MIRDQSLSIPLNTKDSVSAVLSTPKPPGQSLPRGVVIAHGSANDMNHPLILALARGLARKGFPCLRFNFRYRELGRKSVDPEHRLVHAWHQAMDCMRETAGTPGIIAVGKSLGARIAAQAAAAGEIAPERLVFLGYPLHAPGRKEKLRDGPLYEIRQPMLFFEGTRDPFCDLALLDGVMGKLSAPHRLEIIENGDHSFNLPKSDPRDPKEIHGQVVDTCLDWL